MVHGASVVVSCSRVGSPTRLPALARHGSVHRHTTAEVLRQKPDVILEAGTGAAMRGRRPSTPVTISEAERDPEAVGA